MITVATLSVFCNVLIIHVVRVNQHMHSSTNYLIVNMAIGDLVAAVLITIWTVKCYHSGSAWNGDDFFGRYIYCRLGCPLYYVCMLCSIFSLLVISFDRFMAVTRPLKHKSHSSWTRYAVPGIWLASIALPAHFVLTKIYFCQGQDGMSYCVPKPSPFDAVLIITTGFALPLGAILALYTAIAYKLCTRRVPGEQGENVDSQSNAHKLAKKVTYMIICILTAFELSWSPMFIGYVFPFLFTGQGNDSSVSIFTFKLLMISNGSFNALIYAVFNDNFRAAFKEALHYKPLINDFEKVRNKVYAVASSAKRSSIKPKQTSIIYRD